MTAQTTPHTNGPLYETGLAGPFVVGNSRYWPEPWLTGGGEANPLTNAANSHLPLLAL